LLLFVLHNPFKSENHSWLVGHMKVRPRAIFGLVDLALLTLALMELLSPGLAIEFNPQ
jgi:hypothetical protein